ncbi:hypothetical protein IFM89_021132 [Coptis chinensis]|uniref:Pentatricopeptide repeat-containing protein n=1 Tax=Coptis chinensis TaxID=261450 RepID=A0A835M0X2_9MAGN|nr:hypothetical protein IFM89_021132 [Coptis chinensis]
MKIHDVVSWTMITLSYVQIGLEEFAVQTFFWMRESGVCPNEFTFAFVIFACANLAEHGHCKEAIDLFEKMSRVGKRPDDVTFMK